MPLLTVPLLTVPLLTVPLLTVPLLVAAAPPVAAQGVGDASAGRTLAETWCATCHVIGTADKTGTSNGAPPFVAIAAMALTTAPFLRAFLQTPHGRMPDLHLSRNEIDDVAAYILSLRK